MTASHDETDVLVVGAGPAGLLLAGELRLGGVGVIVVDRLVEPTGESRASQLNARTLEIFDQRGLLPRLGELQAEGAGHFGGLPLDVSRVPSRHAGYWKIPQFRTETMLGDWAAELGADIRRGHELLGLSTHPDHVEAEIVGKAGTGRIRAKFLVGCDGEHSAVRRLGGFGFPGTPATRELVRADVEGIDIPARRFERFDNGLAISGRRGDGVTRVMFHAFGDTPGEGSSTPDFGDVVEGWAKITGEDIGGGKPLWVDSFGDASRQAAQYRKDRVLLAGDAAHVQLPAGGQALNLALQDVMNLGWKLVAHVRGRAPAELLDTYHDERHPVGVRILANVQAQAHLLLGGPEAGGARGVFGELLELDEARTHLAVTLSGLDVRYPAGPGDHPLLGTRMPHCEVTTVEGPTSTTALLHNGGGVLLSLSTQAAEQAGLWAIAANRADRVSVVTARTAPGSPLAGVGAVLLRPDGHVAWIDGGATELHNALYRWFGGPALH